jgi:chemotaxis protein methyltransferase CheR
VQAKATFQIPKLTLSDRDFERVAKIIYAYAGITLSQDKRELVRSRIGKRLRAVGSPSYTAYLDQYIVSAAETEAGRRSEEFVHFVDALSTNLTSFFREPVHFEYLKNHVLPALAATRRPVRAWCCAASTGEEPYTMAMTMLEVLGPRSGAKLLATDISTRVLQTAVTGVYPEDRIRSLSPALRGKYFEPRRMPDGSVAAAAVPLMRDMITFRRLNLMESLPFAGPLDFAFCRNVMIYFDRPTRQQLVNRISQVLRIGGYLFTGHSESLAGQLHPNLTQVAPATYRRDA